MTRAWTLLLGEDLHYGDFADLDDTLAGATAELTRRMARAGRIESARRVLDVGCGTGNPACVLAGTHGCEVMGISTSSQGIERARRRAAERGLEDRVRFELRDGMENGFVDAEFDRVWVMESSHLMPRKDALVAECARVLASDGSLVLCDVMLGRELPLKEVLRRARAFDLLRRVYGRARMETRAFYVQQGRECGLELDVEEDLSAATRPTFARWRDNAQRCRDEVTELVGERYLGEFLESCDVLDRFWEEGILGYGLVVLRKS